MSSLSRRACYKVRARSQAYLGVTVVLIDRQCGNVGHYAGKDHSRPARGKELVNVDL